MLEQGSLVHEGGHHDCHAAMRILAVIHPPDTTAAILACLNLPTRAPPTQSASPDQELEDSQQAEW